MLIIHGYFCYLLVFLNYLNDVEKKKYRKPVQCRGTLLEMFTSLENKRNPSSSVDIGGKRETRKIETNFL